MRVYTDGASSNNQRADLREGGWAYVIATQPPVVGYGYQDGATNNQMELLALRMALDAIATSGYRGELIVATDSQYVIGALSGNKIKANADLIHAILDRAKGAGLAMKFEFVRGHSGNAFNELCDHFARLAIQQKPASPMRQVLENTP
ncbi:MAG: reverse transcriptase-like protein [Spirochaetes bacterium]|nr:reverse transcriptase-like protein [Spirochaetota bacterium]